VDWGGCAGEKGSPGVDVVKGLSKSGGSCISSGVSRGLGEIRLEV